MSVSVFANALRTHSRLRVLTATRVALPATRSISFLVAFRTAVPKNVSFSVSRSFTTSRVARNELENNTSRAAASPTIFVANIPFTVTEEDLTQVFSEFGQVEGVRIHRYRDGRSRGMAHVDFSCTDTAIATIESSQQKPIQVAGRDLRVEYPNSRGPHDPNEKVFFSGCAGDESEIRSIFKQFSDAIVKIQLLKDPRNGERTQTGFVQFNSIKTATEAMEALHGTQTPDGEHLAVAYARPTRLRS